MTLMARRFHVFFTDYPATCDLLLLTLVYTLSQGLMLFNHGIFWDDWIVYNMDGEIILETFKQAGSLWTGILHGIVSSMGTGGYRAAAFICYLVAAWCLFSVLSALNIGRYERLFIVIFFAIFPVNSARIALINMPSSFCYALFFFGFWLTSRYIQSRNFWYRVAALLFLFVSFTVNSLLVFYLLIILYIMYNERPEPAGLSGWLRLIPRYTDYLLLPLLFWLVTLMHMKPYGLYENYNQIGTNATAFFPSLYQSFHASFLSVIYHSFSDPFIPTAAYENLNFGNVSPLLMYALAMLTAAYMLNSYRRGRDKQNVIFLLIGIFIFYLGIFPYAAVGKFATHIPFQVEWGSRHQLLVPLGAAFLLVYSTKILFDSKMIIWLVFLVFTVAFISASTHSYLAFQRDWYKQLSLMENFKSLPIIKEDTSFLFNDQTSDLNANNRSYRFYEYSGLLKMTFGNEKRFGYDKHSFVNNTTLEKTSPYLNKYFNLGEFHPKEPERIISIHHGTYELNMRNLISLMIAERTDKKMFSMRIRNIIYLSEKQR